MKMIIQEKDQIQDVNSNSIGTSVANSSDQDHFFDKYKQPISRLDSAFRLFNPFLMNSNSQNEGISGISSGGEKKTRGKYRKYTLEEKQDAVKKMLQGLDAKVVSRDCLIPRRNLLRWKKNGCERKQGGGRPTDNDMQLILYGKIMDNSIKTEKEIRITAKNLTSKGWYCKFCRRFKIWKQQERKTQIQRNL